MEKRIAPGLVIREQNIGEADRLITVLTAPYGLVRAFSRGANTTKSKKLSATALLTYSDFTFSRRRDTWSVDDAEAKEVFFGLRDDVAKAALAQYFCELAGAFCEEGFESEETLRLFLNALSFLESGRRAPAFIKAVTEWRLMCLGGYMPALVGCDVCGTYETDPMFFSYEEGKLYCKDHPAPGSAEVGTAVVKAMRHVALSDFEKIFAFELGGASLAQFGKTAEEYLLHKTQKHFKTLDFFRVIGS